jgi:glucose-6-phosphate 1-epimerase
MGLGTGAAAGNRALVDAKPPSGWTPHAAGETKSLALLRGYYPSPRPCREESLSRGPAEVPAATAWARASRRTGRVGSTSGVDDGGCPVHDEGEGPQFPIAAGPGGLPGVVLTAQDGARAEVCLHGAHPTSWRPSGEEGDRLFLSARSAFAAGAAIRGGIPVCFPQFAAQGPLPNHGFARVMAWTLAGAGRRADGSARAVLRLVDSDATRQLWPHPFALELAVTVSGRSLDVGLAVANTGPEEFSFTAALHTYLDVRDVARATVRGLTGAAYRDKVLGRNDCVERAEVLRIAGEVDRVYRCAPQPLVVDAPGCALAIRSTGFPDTVVWNPGPARAAALADLGPGSEARMLCVEAALASSPLALLPGARWQGTQTLTAI